jgi:hypothetical protein
MKDRHSIVKDIALGLGLAAAVSGAILAAQVTSGPAKSPRTDPLEPCCSVVSIDLKAGTVTAKVTATGKTFTLTDITAAQAGGFKVGARLDLACAVPPNSGTGAVGSAANSTNCGSNVPRNADTRPKNCVATNSAGVEIKIACPENVPIKVAK